jgi:hypothetical protein
MIIYGPGFSTRLAITETNRILFVPIDIQKRTFYLYLQTWHFLSSCCAVRTGWMWHEQCCRFFDLLSARYGIFCLAAVLYVQGGCGTSNAVVLQLLINAFVFPRRAGCISSSDCGLEGCCKIEGAICTDIRTLQSCRRGYNSLF